MFSASLPSSIPFSTATALPSSSARSRRRLPITAAHTTTARNTPRIATSSSHYDILGIPTCATCHEIKAAYRRLARTVHPDVRSDGQEEFMKVHAAYATLTDPNKRAEYDQTLFRQRTVAAPLYNTAVSRSPRRSWETDQCW